MKYRSSRSPADSLNGTVIFLVVKRGSGLQFYTSPNIKQEVLISDWAYMEELMASLAQRSQFEPEVVFEQLRNLSVGPLVTESILETEDSDAAIAKQIKSFTQLLP